MLKIFTWHKKVSPVSIFSRTKHVVSKTENNWEFVIELKSLLHDKTQDKLLLFFSTVTYSGRLGDRYTGLGAQNLTPKKYFSSFLLSVVFQQIRWRSDQWFQDASYYFEMTLNTKIQTKEKNNKTKISRWKKKLTNSSGKSLNFWIYFFIIKKLVVFKNWIKRLFVCFYALKH